MAIAPDAIVIDTSALDVEAAFEAAMDPIRKKRDR
jgi:cytidylate kinase